MTARLSRAFGRVPVPTPPEALVRTLAQLAALTALLTAALTGPAAASSTATATAEPGTAPAAVAPQPREVNQGYSIPVGAITDLGALPVLGGLGLDFARLMGV
ncbi:hypothetical protein ACFXAF_16235 [Kitasatospora sp. NPDC059463]|uniref:hypothetical protein n=1 Tax=unclassified Kitasatospora TaxID=2633591 RepID=UPI0036B81480